MKCKVFEYFFNVLISDMWCDIRTYQKNVYTVSVTFVLEIE